MSHHPCWWTSDERQPDEWDEYDLAAKWCAQHGFSGNIGTPLPELLSQACLNLINEDPEAFGRRVRSIAYQLAEASLNDL